MEKKTLSCAVSVFLAFLLIISCTCASRYSVDLGTSNLYTEDEIRSAINVVADNFKEFEGCRLYSLSYAGDEQSLREFDYNNEYDEAIVINSVFLSPFFGGGAWNAHEVYTWSFILMRKNGGEWKLLTYGYC